MSLHNLHDTLYIRNLPERLSPNTLRKAILHAIAPNTQHILPTLSRSKGQNKPEFPPVLDAHWGIARIYVRGKLRLRGQAFVTFTEPEKAESFIKEFGTGLKIGPKMCTVEYARSSSDSRVKTVLSAEDYSNYVEQRSAAKRIAIGKPQEKPVAKVAKQQFSSLPPNKILLLQNLPKDTAQEELVSKFEKFSGFVEVRLVAVRSVAFVEFESESQATAAMKLADPTVRNQPVFVSYAKK